MLPASCGGSWAGAFIFTPLPELHFIHDNSLEYGASMSALIEQAKAVSDQTPEDLNLPDSQEIRPKKAWRKA